MTKELEREVRRRAGGRCEYCHFPEAHYTVPFHIEHIISRQHRGPTAGENLALACMRCNLQKGPNLAGLDPQTNAVVPLFHPRNDVWSDHSN
jgi:5-methylcytosine-specific restriction endonuclease McrA